MPPEAAWERATRFADYDDQLVLFSSHLHFQHLTVTLQVAKQLAIELDRQNLFFKLQ